MYSDYEFLKVEPGADRVLRITMNRPEKLNASGEIGHGEQGRIWREFDADPEMNVALITGAGRAFSAGGDLEAGNGPLATDMRDGRALVRNMIACRKPIISAINGFAVGGGLAIALLADISIASEKAVLMDGHLKIGLAAGDHAALVWPLAIGLARAKYHLLLCDRITGKEAAEIGLVARCVPHEELMTTAEDIAARLAKGPQFAIQGTKAALNNWYQQNIGIFEHSLYVEALSATLPDAAAGLDAFRTGAEPEFPGATNANMY
ncbi:enoyl-CoA hydratase/isomerase family protein [Amycolatopsis pithecellobii]|uniref:Enoyl-CoA hydratase/isomerase family protein n=1 Tax=Amycolatopsis pithecellobii TaxID=664692 RepID=A0A6N7Z0L6_9PSEU|nr:enoyl-CoA hydratase/isomerase family protein [Amycolatopsis pithecellobii]MTD53004.1 enoyl-CoA hydratase/isomerase family protein [Amycolatopsis pithecellobii]